MFSGATRLLVVVLLVMISDIRKSNGLLLNPKAFQNICFTASDCCPGESDCTVSYSIGCLGNEECVAGTCVENPDYKGDAVFRKPCTVNPIPEPLPICPECQKWNETSKSCENDTTVVCNFWKTRKPCFPTPICPVGSIDCTNVAEQKCPPGEWCNVYLGKCVPFVEK